MIIFKLMLPMFYREYCLLSFLRSRYINRRAGFSLLVQVQKGMPVIMMIWYCFCS